MKANTEGIVWGGMEVIQIGKNDMRGQDLAHAKFHFFSLSAQNFDFFYPSAQPHNEIIHHSRCTRTRMRTKD